VNNDTYFVPMSNKEHITRVEVGLYNQDGSLIQLNNLQDHQGCEFVIGIKKTNKV
jgi:hypothetical protein